MSGVSDDRRIDQLILRGKLADHSVSFSPPRGQSERTYVSLEPDSPLTYGYEEAATHLSQEDLGRLLYWLRTGEALPVGHPLIPIPFEDHR